MAMTLGIAAAFINRELYHRGGVNMAAYNNHSFSVYLAERFGVEEAIFINHLWHWVERNKANNKHFHEGKTWSYNSAAALSVIFPYWTSTKIRKMIDRLCDRGVIVKGNFHDNPYNRTLWLAFENEQSIWGNCIRPNGQIEKDDSANVIRSKGQMLSVKTDTLPDTKPDIPGRDKKSNVKSLEETTMDDLRPWIEEQQKAGVIFDGINIHIELQKCKNRFEGEKRKIGTARNWLLNAVEYARPATGILKPPTRPTFTPQPPSRGSVVVGSPEYHRLQKELGLE